MGKTASIWNLPTPRVFVIGAGASHSDTQGTPTPVPLSRGFFRPALVQKHWRTVDETGVPFEESALYRVASWYFASKGTRGISQLRNLNIEELLSFFDSQLANKCLWPHEDIQFQLARSQLVQYIAYVIMYQSWAPAALPFYSELACRLDPDDTIISFNWDTLLDRCLEAAPKPPIQLRNFRHALATGEFPELSKWTSRELRRPLGSLIKIHGALNLGVCGSPECPRRSRPSLYHWRNVENVIADACDVCGSQCTWCLMPPTAAKKYGDTFFRVQRRISVENLRNASSWVFVGYSFSEFDLEAQHIFRSGRPAYWMDQCGPSHVSIVNPQINDKEWLTRVKDVLGLNSAKHTHGRRVQLRLFSDAQSAIG